VWFCPDCPFNLVSTRRIVQARYSIKLTSTAATVFTSAGQPVLWMSMDTSGLYSCLPVVAPAGIRDASAVLAEGQDPNRVTLPPGSYVLICLASWPPELLGCERHPSLLQESCVHDAVISYTGACRLVE
jgi:hypothetical protein